MIACTQTPKAEEKAEEAPAASVEQPAPVQEVKEEPIVEEKQVFTIVENMPEFPGGMRECMNWLGKNVKYPVIAQENGIQGRVLVQFIVTEEGNLEDIAVVNSVDPYLDAEALRVVRAMPKWKPGMQQGKVVKVKYTLPVMFRLQ